MFASKSPTLAQITVCTVQYSKIGLTSFMEQNLTVQYACCKILVFINTKITFWTHVPQWPSQHLITLHCGDGIYKGMECHSYISHQRVHFFYKDALTFEVT